MTTTDLLDQAPCTRRVPLRVDVATAAAAAACAVVTWFFVAVLPGVELVVRTGAGPRSIGGFAVALTAAVAAYAGMLALRVLVRSTERGLALWTALVLVVATVSLLGPLAAVTTSAALALATLHSVVAAVVLAAGHTSRR
jgi:hypothetical protein